MVKIPNRLEDLYPATAIEKILDVLQQPDLTDRVRETLDRVGIRGNNPLEQVQQAWQQARSWLESMAGGTVTGEPYVINATGQLFHPDFANLPVASPVAQIYAGAATKFQHAERLAERSRRSGRAAFHGNSVAWLTSVHAVLQRLLAGRQVLIARSDLVRIPGLGDLSDLLSGLSVVEVGPANGCTAQDWQAACAAGKKDSHCVLLVSPNGQSLALAEAQRNLAIQAAHEAELPVFALQADSVCSDRLQAELGCPTIHSSLEAGIDCVVAPLNLLLGGPQGALAVGDDDWIEPVRLWSVRSGTALGGAALAAANVAIQLSQLENQSETGIERRLLANPKNLEERARRIAIQLAGNGLVDSASHRVQKVPLGPPPWCVYELENWCVELTSTTSVERLRSRLLAGTHESGELLIRPIASTCRDTKLVLDLRFVDPEDDHLLVAALSAPGKDEPGDSPS